MKPDLRFVDVKGSKTSIFQQLKNLFNRPGFYKLKDHYLIETRKEFCRGKVLQHGNIQFIVEELYDVKTHQTTGKKYNIYLCKRRILH